MSLEAWKASIEEYLQKSRREASLDISDIDADAKFAELRTRDLPRRERKDAIARIEADAASKREKARERIGEARAEHRRAVETAVAEGKDVPTQALRDYPDLKAPAQRARPAQEDQMASTVQRDSLGEKTS